LVEVECKHKQRSISRRGEEISHAADTSY